MKKAVILRGTDGNPQVNWIPWAKNVIESKDFETWIPLLPENHTPNRFVYDEFLKAADWDFSGNLLVGHSSGATTVLNLLQSGWLPKVDTVVLVGTFLNEKLLHGVDWYEPGQFNDLFSDSLDTELIKSKANQFYFLHGSDDPYCDIEDARALCEKLGGTFIEIPGGKHLSGNRKELPEIMSVFEGNASKVLEA